MRLNYNLWEVWMFENQTEEEEEEEEVIFQRDNRKYWCALRKQKPLVIDQFQLQEPKTISSCLDVCFAMVRVMLSLWSLFIEFLGSYNRCRVTNGVMPRVLGPTSFYLKIWVNILIIRILLCSQDEHQNVVVFFIRMLMLMMFFIWVHQWWTSWWVSGFVQGVTWDLLGFIHQKVTSPYASKVAG